MAAKLRWDEDHTKITHYEKGDTWNCVYCLKPEEACSCEDADFISEEGSQVKKNITCPDCKDDNHVHCMECGERPTTCHCPLEDVTDWFCMGCQDCFYWDPFIGAADSLDNDDDDDPIVVETSDGTKLVYTVDGKVFWQDTGEELTCFCEPQKVYACANCKVRRDKPGQVWSYWDLKKKPTESTTYVQQKSVTPTGSTKVFGSWPIQDDADEWDYTHWKPCRHYDRAVKLKNTTVWASSLNDGYDGKRQTKPDFGLYADWSWHPYWRNEHIDWPDFNAPRYVHIAAEQIIDAYSKAVDGQHVEVGCIGGHGRTGTIIACMAVLDGMTADNAINHVRDTYCNQAIESHEQEWYVDWFEAIVNGKRPPKRPERKSYSSSSDITTAGGVTVNTKTYCATREHWDAWKEGALICPKLDEKCHFWWQDVGKFEKGTVNFGAPPPPPSSKEGVRQPKPDYIVINGFKIPKPERGQTHHDPSAKRGCKCDFCRYTDLAAWGVGRAFLEQLDNDDDYINVSGPKGEIIRVKTQPSELDKPKAKSGTPSDEYEWDEQLGWQWKGKPVATPVEPAPKRKRKGKGKGKGKKHKAGYLNRR